LDVGLVVAWVAAIVESICIGARNVGGIPQEFSTVRIAAVWIYDQNPALVQAQAVLADGFRAAMGQL
jgi:hypothetical protein